MKRSFVSAETATRRAVSMAMALWLGTVVPAVAQTVPPASDDWHTKAWVGDLTFVSANALIAGLTAGLLQELRGGSFRDGFALGALGGAMAYGGRRVAAERFWGAGLIGRQISGVGISITRNVAERQRPLQQVWLPLGPVVLKVRAEGGLTMHAQADVFAFGWLMAAALDDRLRFDGSASLSSGAPVFRAPSHRIVKDERAFGGMVVGGIVVTGLHTDDLTPGQILSHERVHVLQYDYAQLLWGDPLEEIVGKYIPHMASVQRRVRFGIMLPLVASGLGQITDIEGPNTVWELEAYYLGRR